MSAVLYQPHTPPISFFSPSSLLVGFLSKIAFLHWVSCHSTYSCHVATSIRLDWVPCSSTQKLTEHSCLGVYLELSLNRRIWLNHWPFRHPILSPPQKSGSGVERADPQSFLVSLVISSHSEAKERRPGASHSISMQNTYLSLQVFQEF